MKKFVVGITGASGAIYGIRFLDTLLAKGYHVEGIITEAGRRVLKEELDLELKGSMKDQEQQMKDFLKQYAGDLHIHDIMNMGASVASGSYPVEAMIIIPCTMGTMASIASGMSSNLLERAADVTIKEGRKLLLVPRETPLSPIHLENMLKLARLGVKMVPPMPGFYIKPQSIQDVVDFVVGKVLDQLEIQHELYSRWNGNKL